MLDVVRLTGAQRMLPCLHHSWRVIRMRRLHPAFAQSSFSSMTREFQPAVAKVEYAALNIGSPGNLRAQLDRPAKFFFRRLQSFGCCSQSIGRDLLLGDVTKENDNAIA